MTLAQFEGRPEALLQQCREHIERLAPPQDQADLLAVTQIMAGLRFPQPELLTLLGGTRIMKESPVLQEFTAETLRTLLLDGLRSKFGEPPQPLVRRISALRKDTKLKRLIILAMNCNSLQDFQDQFAD